MKVTFAHSYSKNSHERAEGKSCALLKSSVLSIDSEMQRQTVGHRGVMAIQSSVCPVLRIKIDK